MKVLLIPHAYHPVLGGTERQCRMLAEALPALGHEAVVLCANVASVDGYYRPGEPLLPCHDEVLGGVAVQRVPYAGAFARRLGELLACLPDGRVVMRLRGWLMRCLRWRFAGVIADRIRRIQPDVVVTLPHLLVNVEAVLRAQARQAFPLVMLPLLHEEDPNWRIEPVRAALCQAGAVVANTRHEAQRLYADYGVAPGRVVVAGNAVSLPPLPAQAPDADTGVLFLGRKVPTKGISELVAAMSLLWQAGVTTGLTLAGARHPGTAAVDACVAALPPAQRRHVSSPDDVPETEKQRLLATARCLVLPSRIESFGLVLLEAWSLGVPVIALDLPVFRELIEHGVDGLLVSPGDTRALADAISVLLADPVRARDMGLAGRRKVAARYTPEAVAARLVEACELALSGPAGQA